ncbi:MAG: PP2C family protein-serine/threonine phosphatase [Armatimonadota bacterium]
MHVDNESLEAVPKRVRVGLYVIRWLIIIGVLIESQLKYATVQIERAEIFWAVVAIAVGTLIFPLTIGRRLGRVSDIVVTTTDILFVTVVVYYSGGLASPFYPLYYVTLITAAVTFGTQGSMLSALAIGIVSLCVQASLKHWALSEFLLVDDITQTFPYLFLIALITGALRDRIQALDSTASELMAQQAAMDRELEVARQVQQAQLPQEIPEINGMKISVLYNPAREVGGDLYEFFPIENDRLGIGVADVAGKGVPAALLISGAKYGIYEHYNENLSKMAADLNYHLLSVTTSETFVTMTYGILAVNTGRFRYFNAGHMPIMVVKPDGGVLSGIQADIPLGVLEAAEYAQRSITLEPGDVLVLYSDGVTDAFSKTEGLEMFQGFLKEVAGSSISSWGERMMECIKAPDQVDDITMVAIHFISKSQLS